jgi:hypothetical protein
MPSVTVDLEDLETLVFTTAALKVIEGALAARKTDPFVRPHLNFTAAHDRLASAMRNARRAGSGTAVDWDGPLTAAETLMLRSIEDMQQFNSPARLQHPEIDLLAAKGCVVIGQQVNGVIWPGATAPELEKLAWFAVKITDRGREKLAKIDGKATANG